jgi:CBS domain-containing protein
VRDDLDPAMRITEARQARRVPVVDDQGQLIAMIARVDIARPV